MTASGNVGIAFALVIGAGLSTSVGALAAFFSKLASTRTLAIGLSLSAGVMLYVSFVEIFMDKGVDALVDGGWSEDDAYRYGTLLFFGGMLATALLGGLAHILSLWAGKNVLIDATAMNEIKGGAASRAPSEGDKSLKVGDGTVVDVEAQSEPGEAGNTTGSPIRSPREIASDGGELEDAPIHLSHKPGDVPAATAVAVDTYVTNDHHQFGLQRMGLMTALAIGIHNIPEGLATFVAALSDPMNGVAIAVAIALHNIPEGVCVAMPVYYATGSRWKGFLWATLSGVAEPIGGLLGYLVLYGNRMSDLTYGVLFCIVAGMMTYISIKELIPTAIKYDPHNKVTSTCVIIGMMVMAASLLLFTI